MLAAVVLVLAMVVCASSAAQVSRGNLLTIRGGLVPEASQDGTEYYEKFNLDYGCEDNSRIAGSMRGFIKTGKLASLPETDPFLKWVNEHLENGAEEFTTRVKPYYVSFESLRTLLFAFVN